MTRITAAALVREAQTRFRRAGVDPRDALQLGCAAWSRPAAWILAHPEIICTPAQVKRYRTFVKRRMRGAPLAYVIGKQEFFGFAFTVSRGVLIPRPESELIIEHAIAEAPARSLVIDLGTGSGCLAISLARRRLDVSVLALDPSPLALAVARTNIRRARLSGRVKLQQGNSAFLTTIKLPRCWALMANLPYLTSREAKSPALSPEPRIALDGGRDGLAIFRSTFSRLRKLKILPQISWWEVDPRRAAKVRRLVSIALPDHACTIHRDLSGRQRLIRCRLRRLH